MGGYLGLGWRADAGTDLAVHARWLGRAGEQVSRWVGGAAGRVSSR